MDVHYKKTLESVVPWVNENRPPPEGVASTVWFYAHAYLRVYESRGPLYDAAREELQELAGELSSESDYLVGKFFVTSAHATFSREVVRKGVRSSPQAEQLSEEVWHLLRTAFQPDLTTDAHLFAAIRRIVRELGEGLEVSDLEDRMHYSDRIGFVSVDQSKRSAVLSFLELFSELVDCSEKGFYAQAGALMYTIHINFSSWSPDTFLKDMFRDLKGLKT